MSYLMISFHDVMAIRSIFVFLPCHYFLPFLLPPSFLATKNSIFEPNVKQNTYSRLLYEHDIFRHFFSHWAQHIGKRVDPKYFWYLKALFFQDPWVTIIDLSKARFCEKKSTFSNKITRPRNGILFPKLVWPTVWKNGSSSRDKFRICNFWDH